MDVVVSGCFEMWVKVFDEIEFLCGLYKFVNVIVVGLVLVVFMIGVVLLVCLGSGGFIVESCIVLVVFVVLVIGVFVLFVWIGW